MLSAFKRWGVGAPTHFRGTFAVAFWDDPNKRLILASDHLGQHTIFYARGDGFLAFATSLRSLLALPDVPHRIDDGALAALLADMTPEEGSTLYASIRRIPAASVMVIDPVGGIEIQRYWQPDWARRLRRRRDEDYVEEGRALLDQAVGRMLPSGGPLVCMLSGGLDSSGVAVTAARVAADRTVHALTVAPAEGVPRYEPSTLITDERTHAASVAALQPNMAWEWVSNHDLHPIDRNPERLFLSVAMPIRNIMNVGWFAPLRDKARALGATTILGGAFGNVGLSWHGLSGLASMAKQREWGRLLREVKALARARGVSSMAILRSQVLRPLLPPILQTRIDAMRGRAHRIRFSPINPDFARSMRIDQLGLACGDGVSLDSTAARRRLFTYMQRSSFVGRAMGDVYGVEARHPLGDLDLLEFCFAVPDEQYIRNGVTRWLARRVLADRLPPQVVNETRRGFQCPEFLHRMTLRRDAIVEGVEALERSPLASRVLDVPRLKRLAGNWPTDPATTSFNEYGAVLNRGLHYGQFLRWIEGGNQ